MRYNYGNLNQGFVIVVLDMDIKPINFVWEICCGCHNYDEFRSELEEWNKCKLNHPSDSTQCQQYEIDYFKSNRRQWEAYDEAVNGHIKNKVRSEYHLTNNTIIYKILLRCWELKEKF